MHKSGNKLNLTNAGFSCKKLTPVKILAGLVCKSVLTCTILAWVWEAQWRQNTQTDAVRVKVGALNVA